jgi:hypothetical protein
MPETIEAIPQNGTVHDAAVVLAQPQQIMQPQYQPANIAMPIISLQAAIDRRRMVIQYVTEMFVTGVDFHEIPGTGREGEAPKKVLSKAGAENLCSFFGLRPQFSVAERDYDITGERYGEPRFYARYKCLLVKNDEILGDGEGSCNSWESKYRYRWVSADHAAQAGFDPETLPKRGDFIIEPEFAIKKAETGGKYGKPAEYWKAFDDAITAGTATKVKRKKKDGGEMDAWQIGSYVYRVPNPEISDIINTVEKMAQKRALIAAVLIATGISGMFTQDLEDLQPEPEYREGTPVDAVTTQPPKQESKPAQQTASAPKPPAASKPEPPKPEPAKPAAPNNLSTRIGALAKAVNLTVPDFKQKHFVPFCHGFFGLEQGAPLPADPTLYAPAVAALEKMTPEQSTAFYADSAAFGRAIVANAAKQVIEGSVVAPEAPAPTVPQQPAPSQHLSTLIGKVAQARSQTHKQVTDHLEAVGITADMHSDAVAYLRLCAVTKTAKLAITAANKALNTSVADVVARLERKVGCTVEDADVHALELALADITSGE